MKIEFLIHNAYGIGGTIRSTANLSAALAAAHHDVEVVSVHRVAESPELPFDPRVRLRSLIDMRPDSPSYEGEHELNSGPNSMFPEKGVDFGRMRYTRLHDQRLAAYLEGTEADAVIATRPILNGYLARYARTRRGRPAYLRIGQEHLSLDAHSDQLRGDQNAAIAEGLDAFVTVSEADAQLYRAALPTVRAKILCIPNGVTPPSVTPSALDSRTVVAAGRLVAVKRYDRLINAFAKVAAEHPDWTLRIYGRGPDQARLRGLVDELGLYNRVFLMGPASPIETEWAKGAIAAVSSDMESFGMTIVEAMHCGVPVVATDCPHGPAEIITHGADGLLVPLAGGVDAYADALKSLIKDQELRARMGVAARAKAATYAPSVIARRYEDLMESLRPGVTSPRRSLTTRLRAAFASPREAAAPAPDPAEQEAVVPAASARMTPDGSLAVAPAPDTLPDGPLDLVLRKRKDPQRREVRVPVGSPVAAAGPVATVPRAAHVLAEGRWDCYVAPREAPADRRRLRARLVETAALLTLPPVVTAEGLSSWIPYTTADGYLAVRTWLRPAHAEVNHVLVSEEGATVTAKLLGDAELRRTGDASPPPGAEPDTVTLTPRADPAAEGTPGPRTAALTVPVRALSPAHFQFTLPYAEAQAHHGTADHTIWDLHLHTAGRTIPIGRITGDTVERKKPNPYPAVELPHPTDTTTRLRPYYTATNALALSARSIAAKADDPGA
ncbi:glycosyl transferase family 1 [Streptomyces longispororuber]|uniref:D-inositol 3-phosphate glycosyltransferase n=1 Tax=Streptomyces longispororuber TaxID=68230 RepID=A0A918ZCN2_9ACTN|nr:glycosyltransferase [Streptomyces longispororuber]GHE45321.1 glycosyl transferase family 1 [Streptomyces longispororuber]